MLMFGNRDPKRVIKAATSAKPYIAAFNMMRAAREPHKWLFRYLTGGGVYPASMIVRTALGPCPVSMWTSHDLLTLNEIFFRRDYLVAGNERIIVDFGSNVGISALYFMTSAPHAHLYLFEPVPFNIGRLKLQLAGQESRFTLSEVAVGTVDGPVSFGIEESGRYGGIDKSHDQQITVPCRTANSVLSKILDSHDMVDLLKVDIEGSERAVVSGLAPTIARRIRRIYAETKFETNPLPESHVWAQSGNLATLTLRSRVN